MARLAALILAATAWAQHPTGTLLERLGSPDPLVRVEAMDEVRRLPVEDRRALARHIAAARPEVAMRLWRALGSETRREPALVAAALRPGDRAAGKAWIEAARELGVVPLLASSPPLPDDVLVTLLSPMRAESSGPMAVPLGEESLRERPAMLPAPEGLDVALPLSRHPSHLVRAALADWLANVSGADARRCLEGLCADRSATVRIAAIRALLPRIAEERERFSLTGRLLVDPSPAVRAEALLRLASIVDGRADLCAWALLWDPDHQVRRFAARHLHRRRVPWALPYLMRCVAHEAPDEASRLEGLLLESSEPRAAVELAARLDAVPRAGAPAALHLLDGLARATSLPGPCWVPWGREAPLPASLHWPTESAITGIRVRAAASASVRVQVSRDGAEWTDLGVFVLARGERLVPIGRGWSAARVVRVPWPAASLGPRSDDGSPDDIQLDAWCCAMSGPDDPVAAWRAWSQDARPWLSGREAARLAIAARLLGEGKPGEALAQLREILKNEPAHPVARLWAAEALMERSAFGDALDALEALLADRPRYAPALALRARALEVLEDFDGARESLGRAIEADPAEASYRSRRANLATKSEDHAAAVADLAIAVALRPEDAGLRFQHGYELFSVGRYEEGLAEFRRVVARDPGNVDARYNIACGLARLGRVEEALAALQRAVQSGFHDGDFARKDPDLESLRGDARFEEILRGGGSPGQVEGE